MDARVHENFPGEFVYQWGQGSAGASLAGWFLKPFSSASAACLQLLPLGYFLKCLWMFQKPAQYLHSLAKSHFKGSMVRNNPREGQTLMPIDADCILFENNKPYIHSFICLSNHSTIQQIFIHHMLWAGKCVRFWDNNGEQGQDSPHPHGEFTV